MNASTSGNAGVPAELIVDFDMYHLNGWTEIDDVHLAWKGVQDSHPSIFWTPRNGGHWVVTRGADIKYVVDHPEEFSSSETFLPRDVMPPQLPVNLDQPQHTAFRRLLAPAFQPESLKRITANARATARDLVERLRPQGQCEFVGEFAGAMPVIVFLGIMGLPEEDYVALTEMGTNIARPNDADGYAASRAALADYIRHWIKKFRANPGPGAISSVVHGQVDGRKLTEDEIENLCILLLGGGLDTVKSVMSFAAHFLANSPEHRHQLIAEPQRIPNAVEEFLRRFGTSNLGRTVSRDMVFQGVSLKAGDMVMLPFPLTGLDERENPDPLVVDFKRTRIRHTAFGGGPHLCAGAAVGRRELAIFLEEWLPRIPDFHVKPGTKMRTETGLVNIPTELWLEWTP